MVASPSLRKFFTIMKKRVEEKSVREIWKTILLFTDLEHILWYSDNYYFYPWLTDRLEIPNLRSASRSDAL